MTMLQSPKANVLHYRLCLTRYIARTNTRIHNGNLLDTRQPCRKKAHPVRFFERLAEVKKECKQQCLRQFAPTVELEELYRNYACVIFLDQKERGDLALSEIHRCRTRGEKKIVLKTLGMSPLCQRCFSLAMGLSQRDLQRKSKKVSEKVLQHVRAGASPQGRLTTDGADARLYLKTLRDGGNFSPLTGSVHLGPWPKKEYWRQYKVKYPDGVSLKYFLLLWRNLFPEMKVLKEQRMCPCPVCGSLKDKIAQTDKKDKAKLDKYEMELKAHCDDAHEERCAYHETRKYARENAKYVRTSVLSCRELLCIIIDWMAQRRTHLPHLVHYVSADLLPTRVCGAIAHGQWQEEFFYISSEWSGEANLTINCLLRTIDYLAKGNWKNLPPKLHVQMDNCFKENKNNHMFGFLAALVQLELFTIVTASFLLRGHTHEDVDQGFSRGSKKV